MPIKELCEGLPKAFADYLTYVRNLGFTEKPDYEYLISLFTRLQVRHKGYDWTGCNTITNHLVNKPKAKYID